MLEPTQKYGTVPTSKNIYPAPQNNIANTSSLTDQNLDPISGDSSKLFQSYKDISCEIDLTKDMERRFEEELAALRLRRSFLKQVQEKTEAIISTSNQSQPQNPSNTQPIESTVQHQTTSDSKNQAHKSSPEKRTTESSSPQKSRNFSASSHGTDINSSNKLAVPTATSRDSSSQKSPNLQTTSGNVPRDSLSSPGVTSIVSANASALPPGFDGSSVPLVPTAAQCRPVQVKDRDPFDPPEKLPSFLVPSKIPLDGFVEGQLISLSISSQNSSVHGEDDLDSVKMMEELKLAFELHQKDVQTVVEDEQTSRDDELDDSKTKSDDRNLSRDEISNRINLMEDASNTPSLMEKFLNSQCDVSEDFAASESAPIPTMSTFRSDLVSPDLTETSGEYRIADRGSTGPDGGDDDASCSGGQIAETDIDGAVSKQAGVQGNKVAASEIKRSGHRGIVTNVSLTVDQNAAPRNLRSFEVSFKINSAEKVASNLVRSDFMLNKERTNFSGKHFCVAC